MKPRHHLAAAVRQTLSENLERGEGVVVALSGGMDSASLLDCALLHAAAWPVAACHVNHGISPRAEAWEDFCRKLCEQRGIEFHVYRAKPPQPPENASEQWAREVRMGFFADLPVRAVLAAHHQEDQAETVLFRVLRGANACGLAAMRPAAPLPGAPDKLILRPWLNIPKDDIRDYARTRRLSWVEDEDNRNIERRRNFLRCKVMPVIRECFPNGSQTLASAADRFNTASALLAQLADEDDKNASNGSKDEWDLDYFRRLDEARLQNFLHIKLSRAGTPLSEKGLAEATRQLLYSSAVAIPIGGVSLVVHRGKLQIRPAGTKTPNRRARRTPKMKASQEPRQTEKAAVEVVR